MRLAIRLGTAENPRLKRLLILLVIVGIPSILYTYVYPPVAARMEAMQRELAQEKVRLEALRREAEAARDAAQKLAEARARLDDLARLFPARVDQPRLLEYLENAAKAEGLTITKIDYRNAEAVESFQRIPVELTVTGPFAAQANFALALQGMPWLFRFDGSTLRAQTGKGAGSTPAAPAGGPVPGTVEAVYKISLYIDAPAPAPPQQGAGSNQGNQGNQAGTQGSAARRDAAGAESNQ